jgi:hypothetical protein
VQFVNKLSKQVFIFGFAASLLAGCGTVDLNAIGEMLGLSKRTYTARPEAPTAGAGTTATPVVIAPPVSANANANAPDFISYRVAAARRIMQANGSSTFAGSIPDPLLAVPVMEITLNRDGSVKSIDVLRTPHFAPETADMAKTAIMRAAPFGSVAHLPQPWIFTETFLYDDNFKFQLHSLQP